MKTSIPKRILELLEENGIMYKGKLEDVIRKESGHYGDTIGRRLRELTQTTKIIKTMDGKRAMYRVKPVQLMWTGLK